MVKQLKIVLGEELRRKLDEVSAGSGKSIAEEIRSRVEQSIEEQLSRERQEIVAEIHEEVLGEIQRRAAARDAELEASLRLGDEYRAEMEKELEAVRIAGLDDVAVDFIDYVKRLVQEIRRETGFYWHEHAGATEVFVAALAVRARRLGPEGGPIAFEVQAEPLRGKQVTSETELHEFGRVLEWIDSRAHESLIGRTHPPKTHSATPTTEEPINPPTERGSSGD
jgi:hypothetical protein